jgi:flagellar L-ring protein precursor FlgH
MNRVITMTLAFVLMQSCASVDSRVSTMSSDFSLTYPEPKPQIKSLTGSIMDNGNALYPAGRAYKAGTTEIGDIVTVILNETAQASRITGLSTERASSNTVIGANQASSLLPGGSFFNGIGTDGSTISSTGSGTAGQSASLTGSISAVVVDVMPNGNLVVFGEKKLGLNEGSEMIIVKGVIRPDDIMPNNTVLSTRLANAQFSYSGVGELARATKAPWGVNVLFGLWPF